MGRFVFVALFVAAWWPLQRASRESAARTRRAQTCENGLRYQPPVFCDIAIGYWGLNSRSKLTLAATDPFGMPKIANTVFKKKMAVKTAGVVFLSPAISSVTPPPKLPTRPGIGPIDARRRLELYRHNFFQWCGFGVSALWLSVGLSAERPCGLGCGFVGLCTFHPIALIATSS